MKTRSKEGLLLVAEIGSTTTLVSAFAGIGSDHPVFLGQGLAPTTVVAGDVTDGLAQARRDLERRLEAHLPWEAPLFATSSAAGGLKMTVHGLVYDMTVKAAKEAALGAGAVLRLVTAGPISQRDLARIESIRPNMIMLSGGVEHGETVTALTNAEALSHLTFRVPILYAGNSAISEEIEAIFRLAGFAVRCVPNVYPRIDEMQVEPARRAIQELFEGHIVHAPGMEKIRSMVTGPIAPTPGAVMRAATLLADRMGDLVVMDIGGATTDVHSVTDGSETYQKLLVYPEPRAKRTVEGDLGLYLNARQVAELIGTDQLTKELGDDLQQRLQTIPPIPRTPAELQLAQRLADGAAQTAMSRHAGRVRHLYGPSGRVTIVEGKDLSQVRWLIGTGGALTRLPKRAEILGRLRRTRAGQELWPSLEAEPLIDRHYIMAAAGVMSVQHPKDAFMLLQASLNKAEEV